MNKLIFGMLFFPFIFSFLFINRKEDDTTFFKYLGIILIIALNITILILLGDNSFNQVSLLKFTINVSIDFNTLLTLVFSNLLFLLMLLLASTTLAKSFYFFAYNYLGITNYLLLDYSLNHFLMLLFVLGVLTYICLLLYFNKQIKHVFKYIIIYFILIIFYLFLIDLKELQSIEYGRFLIDISQMMGVDPFFLLILLLVLILSFLNLKICSVQYNQTTYYVLPFFASLMQLAIYMLFYRFAYPIIENSTQNNYLIINLLCLVMIFLLIRTFKQNSLQENLSILWNKFNILIITGMILLVKLDINYGLLATIQLFFPLFIYWMGHIKENSNESSLILSKCNHLLFFIIGGLLPFSTLFTTTHLIMIELVKQSNGMIFFVFFFYLILFLFYRKIIIIIFNKDTKVTKLQSITIALILITITCSSFYYLGKMS